MADAQKERIGTVREGAALYSPDYDDLRGVPL